MGVNFYSWVNMTMSMEFFNTYTYTIMFSFIPFDITPYTQMITWMRPEYSIMTGKPWDFRVSAWYDMHFLWVVATAQEKFKILIKSFVDAIKNNDAQYTYPYDVNNWMYDSSATHAYEDPIWQFKPLEMFVYDTVPDLGKYFGTHNFFSWWVMSNTSTGPNTTEEYQEKEDEIFAEPEHDPSMMM
jgi:hypothetical protein